MCGCLVCGAEVDGVIFKSNTAEVVGDGGDVSE